MTPAAKRSTELVVEAARFSSGLSVACTFCGAAIGAPCVRLRSQRPHRWRLNAALKERRETLQRASSSSQKGARSNRPR